MPDSRKDADRKDIITLTSSALASELVRSQKEHDDNKMVAMPELSPASKATMIVDPKDWGKHAEAVKKGDEYAGAHLDEKFARALLPNTDPKMVKQMIWDKSQLSPQAIAYLDQGTATNKALWLQNQQEAQNLQQAAGKSGSSSDEMNRLMAKYSARYSGAEDPRMASIRNKIITDFVVPQQGSAYIPAYKLGLSQPGYIDPQSLSTDEMQYLMDQNAQNRAAGVRQLQPPGSPGQTNSPQTPSQSPSQGVQ